MVKVGTSNQDRTISLKAAVRSCINKKNFILVTWLLNRLPRNQGSIHSTGKFVFPASNNEIKNMWINDSSTKHNLMAAY